MSKLIVIVATDFSAPSRAALQWAFDYAQLRDCELHLYHAVEESQYEGIQKEMSAIEADARKQLDSLADAGARDRIGKVVQHVGGGNPGDGIATLAGKLSADLVVMGTHGRKGFRRAVAGSVAEYVVRHAPCTVVCVKA